MPDALFDPPWNERVKFDAAGGFAYVPNTAFVRDSDRRRSLPRRIILAEGESSSMSIDDPTKEFRAIRGTFDTIRVVARPAIKGNRGAARPCPVRPRHGVLLLRSTPRRMVRSHARREPVARQPVARQPVARQPVARQPVARQSVARQLGDPNGPIRSSARPADPPRWYTASASAARHARPPLRQGTPQVIVIDTGLAASPDLPDFLRRARGDRRCDRPRRRSGCEPRQWLDPAAGHGTFIAGIIERIAPGCAIEVSGFSDPQGEGIESEVVDAINEIADRQNSARLLEPFVRRIRVGAGADAQRERCSAPSSVASSSLHRLGMTARAGRRSLPRSPASCLLGQSVPTDRVVLELRRLGPCLRTWNGCGQLVLPLVRRRGGPERWARHRQLQIVGDLERHILCGAGRDRCARAGDARAPIARRTKPSPASSTPRGSAGFPAWAPSSTSNSAPQGCSGAKIRLGMPKSRPISLLGRENTPGNAEIAPKQLAGEYQRGTPGLSGVPLFVARSAAARPTPL